MKAVSIFLCVILPFLLPAQQSEKMAEAVRHRLERGGEAEWLLVFDGRASLDRAGEKKTKEARGRYVFEQLRGQARQSQAVAIRMLERLGVPYQSFWIVNALRTRGDARLAEALARLPEVVALIPDPMVRLERPAPVESGTSAREEAEWGVRQIKADQVWALGFRGQGVVVAGQDTGCDWDHPALREQYRGWNGSQADHHYNWHDAVRELNPLNNDSTSNPMNNPCGLGSPVPCDDNNHGTHTMGTMVGDDGAGNQIGVAPEAQWIACRNMDRGWGSPSTYLECFQWFLAPTDLNGEHPDPDLAPDVVNNSWRCPEIEGCTPANWGLMEQAVQNLRAAGILVVVSAGNQGSGCGTIDAPPAFFEGSFSVGATRPDDTIAAFSGRGLILADSSFRLKPNVAAPGLNVRSAIPDGAYASFSGTSMAAPHVAGVVALMLSANPDLRGQVETLEAILEETAKPMLSGQDCGGVSGSGVPNAVYGYGRIDALLAVQRALEVTATPGVEREIGLRVFPNPARDVLFVSVQGLAGTVQFRLFSPAGKTLLHRQWEVQGPWLEALKPDLAPGVYFYRLDTPEGSRQGKLILH